MPYPINGFTKANYIDLTGSSDEEPVITTISSDSDDDYLPNAATQYMRGPKGRAPVASEPQDDDSDHTGFTDSRGNHRRGAFQENHRRPYTVPVSPTDDVGWRYTRDQYSAPWGVDDLFSSDEEASTEVEDISTSSLKDLPYLPPVSDKEGDSEGEPPAQLQRRDSVVYHRRGDPQRRYTTSTHWNRIQENQAPSEAGASGSISRQFVPPRGKAWELSRNEDGKASSSLHDKGEQLPIGGDRHTNSLKRKHEDGKDDDSKGDHGRSDCKGDHDQVSRGVLQAIQEHSPTCRGCMLIKYINEDFLANCDHQNQKHIDFLAGCYLRGMAEFKPNHIHNRDEAEKSTETATTLSLGPTSNREVNSSGIVEETLKSL